MNRTILTLAIFFSCLVAQSQAEAKISGDLRCWHKVTLSLEGPEAKETDDAPNPFLDYGFWVDFTHVDSGESFRVPGYFAADGDAAESSATSGALWRVHLAPHKPGRWTYTVHFVQGRKAALTPPTAAVEHQAVKNVYGVVGEFNVLPTDKSGRDFRAHGRLQYVGQRYLKFAESGETFLKAGPDSPETILAYKDFDGTTTRKAKLKTWEPHLRDWREGDPQWKVQGEQGKGRGLIGAVNYLASKGLNTLSFIPYNAGGDGDNVWPMVDADDKLHYDCSKLDQWQIVFDHAQQQGLHLHFKLQETENDDNRKGNGKDVVKDLPAALDGGDLGIERKLYLKEMVARFGYELALNWNLGEENTQSLEQQQAMIDYLRAIDPYSHPIVLHSYPNRQDALYEPHLGNTEGLTGVSLQNDWDHAHRRTKQWVEASNKSGHPWVCANDEQGPAGLGVPADKDYPSKDVAPYTQDDIRKQTLWGTLMAGGGGVEYYFGYKLAENDLLCEDFRSRDGAWDDCRVALEFFSKHKLPLVEMTPADQLATVPSKDKSYCLAMPGKVYLVYLLEGGDAQLDLSGEQGEFKVAWYNPRSGGELQMGDVKLVAGGGKVKLGSPPAEANQDWLVVVRR